MYLLYCQKHVKLEGHGMLKKNNVSLIQGGNAEVEHTMSRFLNKLLLCLIATRVAANLEIYVEVIWRNYYLQNMGLSHRPSWEYASEVSKFYGARATLHIVQIFMPPPKKNMFYRVEKSDTWQPNLLRKPGLFLFVCAYAKWMLFPHHNHFVVVLKNQNAETHFSRGEVNTV